MKILRIALALVAIATCVAIASFYHAWSNARSAVEQSNARLLAKNLPTTVTELETWNERELSLREENAALQYLFAAQLFDASEFAFRDQLPILGEAKMPPLGNTIPDNLIQHMKAFLTEESEAFAVLDKALTIDESLYTRDSLERVNINRALQAIQLRALHAIAIGDEGKAITCTEQFVDAVNSLRGAPIGFACRNRSAWTKTATQTVERLLNDVAVDAEALRRLDAHLRPIQQDKSLLLAIIGERCVGLGQIEQDGGLMSAFVQADYCAFFDYYVTLAEEGLPQRAGDLTPESQDRTWETKPYRPNLFHVARTYYDARASLETARAAILVQRHRAKGGRLPEVIEDFPDGIRADWPEDPYTGKSIQYKRMDAGFITYSMGHDASGDGNLPTGAAPNAHRDGPGHTLIVRVLK